MSGEPKLCILGGDERQRVLAELLAADGFEAAVWGLSSEALLTRATRCATWADARGGAAALLLPLPCSPDDRHLYCPQQSAPPLLADLFRDLPAGTPVFGGRLTPAVLALGQQGGLFMQDVAEEEAFCVENALPTAEGALAIAMEKLPVTLAGSHAAVTGYGRIGRVLAGKLRAMGAQVTVYARRAESLAWARLEGHEALELAELHPTRIFRPAAQAALRRYDVWFNTIPAVIFSAETLRALAQFSDSPLLIDLASAPGGCDTEAARNCGIRLVRALSLPGKVAPVSAGRILHTHMLRLLRQAGLQA